MPGKKTLKMYQRGRQHLKKYQHTVMCL